MKKLTVFIAAGLLSVAGISSVQAMPGGGSGGQKRPVFADLDLDGDGYITFAEFETREIPRGDHSEIFGHIDADGDGSITEEELSSHKPPRRNARND